MWDIERICALASVHIDMCGIVSIYVGYRAYMWDIERICAQASVHIVCGDSEHIRGIVSIYV